MSLSISVLTANPLYESAGYTFLFTVNHVMASLKVANTSLQVVEGSFTLSDFACERELDSDSTGIWPRATHAAGCMLISTIQGSVASTLRLVMLFVCVMLLPAIS